MIRSIRSRDREENVREVRRFLIVSVVSFHCGLARGDILELFRTVHVWLYTLTVFRTGSLRLYRVGSGSLAS